MKNVIIRDDSAKSGDLHNQDKAKNKGEELKVDLGRPLTEEEEKILCQIKGRLTIVMKKPRNLCSGAFYTVIK